MEMRIVGKGITMIKRRVKIKTLHKLFPNRNDFKPSIWHKILSDNVVTKNNNGCCYLEQRLNKVIATILFVPLLIINIVWRGISCIPELWVELIGMYKPYRTDTITNSEYEELIK